MRYQQAARTLAGRSDLAPVKIGFLADITVQPWLPYLAVELAREGFAGSWHVGPFNAVHQTLIAPSADEAEALANCDALFLSLQLETVCQPLCERYLRLTQEQVEQHADAAISELMGAIQSFRQRSAAPILLTNFPRPAHPMLGVLEAMRPDGQDAAITRLNWLLADAARQIPDVYIVDLERACSMVGYANARNAQMWQLARAPLSSELMPLLARHTATLLRAARGVSKKCLVLDLDNTLWGGVIGEDGLAGIKLGQSGAGLAFQEFHKAILSLYDRGVILAVASKNNPEDAEAAIDTHPDMLIRREHIAALRINWEPKPQNLAAIAQELNIGVDALVFFDDNPAERAQMRAALPQVLTIEAPADPSQYVDALMRCGAFDKLTFTREDRQRGAMYQAQAQRKELQAQAVSMDEYLQRLHVQAAITAVDEVSFPRALELIHKTNQFNLTTRRHPETALRGMLESPDYALLILRAADKFGDNGLTALCIAHHHARDRVRIDTFLMSCRVLGRGLETALLAEAAAWADARGAAQLEGLFIPTPKNAPAAEFYPRHGFTLHETQADNTQLWRLALSESNLAAPDHIHPMQEPQP
ncbi:putative FkbH-like protein [Magnetofaba australis IT-1]|uniref:Putative FkbH-like protein n=2 Tax=Magnetofaba TaxID=1472292 RepID=A0A1Y2KAH3_9PROT|nr:putative FkbH-like protein [Magnetofaba australis IT-1]